MRTKPDYYYSQSGCIPFKKNNDSFLILLVTTRKNKNWTIPKGIIENGFSAKETAKAEAYEEAGICGEISHIFFDQYSYNKWQDKCHVNVYSMNVADVLEKWPEQEFRERKWFTPNEIQFLKINKELKSVILRFIDKEPAS